MLRQPRQRRSTYVSTRRITTPVRRHSRVPLLTAPTRIQKHRVIALVLALVSVAASTATADASTVGAAETNSSVIYGNRFDSGGRVHDYGISELSVNPAGGGQLAPDKYASIVVRHRLSDRSKQPLIQPGQQVKATITLPEKAEYIPFQKGWANHWLLEKVRPCIDLTIPFYRLTCTAGTVDGRTVITKTATLLNANYTSSFWDQWDGTTVAFHLPEVGSQSIDAVQSSITFPVDERSTLPATKTTQVTLLADSPSTFGAYDSEAVPNNPNTWGAWRVGDSGKFIGNPQPVTGARPLPMRTGERVVLTTGIYWSEPKGSGTYENYFYYDPTADPAHPVDNICTRTPPEGFNIACGPGHLNIYLTVTITRTGPDTTTAFESAAPIEIPVTRSARWVDDQHPDYSAPFSIKTNTSIGAVSNYVSSTLAVPLAPSTEARIADVELSTLTRDQHSSGEQAAVLQRRLEIPDSTEALTERITLHNGVFDCAQTDRAADKSTTCGQAVIEREATPGEGRLLVLLDLQPDEQPTATIELLNSAGQVVTSATIESATSDAKPHDEPGPTATTRPSADDDSPEDPPVEGVVPACDAPEHNVTTADPGTLSPCCTTTTQEPRRID